MNLDTIARTPPLISPGPDLTWLFVKKLGQGGYGVASLWYTVDQQQNVISRMVIKTQVLVNPARQLVSQGRLKGTLRESFYQGTMRKSGYTADLFSEASYPVHGAPYSIYSINMPYYPYGDLQNLIYHNASDSGRSGMSEPFAWYLFLRLARAVVAMDTSFDQFLLHLDIKPGNILLGSPGSLGHNSDFIMYPPAYLADFGLSEVSADGDFQTQKDVLGSGTPGWMAPEIFKYSRTPQEFESTAVALPLGSFTNVWQIGRVMLNVLDMDPGADQIDWISLKSPKRGPKCSKTEFDNVEGNATWFWSKDLLDLVHECCAFHPFDRPYPRGLLEKILKLMPKHTSGMDKWGTLDWIIAEEARLAVIEAQAKKAKQAEEEKRKADEERRRTDPSAIPPRLSVEATTALPSPLQWFFQGVKRALSLDEEEPMTKRLKLDESPEGVTRRRKAMVAKQMKEGRTKPPTPKNVLPSDQSFVLDENLKLVYPHVDDKLDPDQYFRRRVPVAPAVR